MALRFFLIAAAIILLAAIAICSLAPSSYMTEIRFIPTWLATWADANPNFRNFPVFAAFAALLFVVSTFYQVGRRGDRSRQAPVLVTSYGRWRLAFGVFAASSLLGALLEVAQARIPGRWADPFDVMWSAFGALVGACVASFAVSLFKMRYSGNSANATCPGSSVPHS